MDSGASRLDPHDFEFAPAGWHSHRYARVERLIQERLRQRRKPADRVGKKLRLIHANNRVRFFFALRVSDHDARAKSNDPFGSAVGFGNFRRSQAVLNLTNPLIELLQFRSSIEIAGASTESWTFVLEKLVKLFAKSRRTRSGHIVARPRRQNAHSRQNRSIIEIRLF